VIANGWESHDTLSRQGYRQHTERMPLRALVKQYELKLTATNNTSGYVDDTLRIISAICDHQGWKIASDISADGMTSFVVALKDKPCAVRTVQKYIRAMKGFTGWLVKTEKLPRDPLASIQAPTPSKGNRRMLLPDEWPWLESATVAAGRFGMTGAERLVLYRLAIETGLRAGELRDLVRSSLVLNAERPYIVAKAGSTKNRKRAQLYVNADLAEALSELTICADSSRPLFALPSEWDMADMLRADLAAARAAWIEAAKPDIDEVVRREQSDFLLAKNHAGEMLDFHALRHTCGAWLVHAGVSLNVVQKVMRHSTITLTIDTYGHLLPGAEAEAVADLAAVFAPIDRPTHGGRSKCAVRNAGSRESHPRDAQISGHKQKQRKSLPRSDLRARRASDARELQTRPAGFEPATCGLEVRCSIQLSYGRLHV
jgi:integrase